MQTGKTVAMTVPNGTLAAFGRSYGVGLVVGLIGAMVLFHDLVGKPLATTLWGNDLDPNIIVWTVEWGYHTIFERLAPLDVWNANSYFPYPKSLAFSDSLFSAQLLYAPLRLLGFGLLPALYCTLAGVCIIGTVMTDRLLQGFAFKPGERALIVVAAHFSLPMTAFLMGHFQLFGMQLVPPFLLALHRLFNKWRGKDLILVTALFCLAGGFATYVVPMVGLLAVSVFLVFSVRVVRGRSAAEIVRSLGWKGAAASIVLLALFFVIQLLPYLSLFGTLPPQQMTETFLYSARPWSILLHSSGSSFWYKPPPMNYGYWERAAFPGLPLLILAAVGGIAVLRRWPVRRLESGRKPIIPLAAYAVTVFIVCWVLSWGPYLQVNNDKMNLPFLVLAKLIPGVENIRAPGRYAQFYGLPLGLLAVVGVRWAATKLRIAASVMAAFFAVVVLVDQMPKVQTYPFAIAHADFFRAAKADIGEGKPVIVLPIAGADHLGTWSNRIQQLLSSTIHWAKLVTGAGSRDTPEQNELLDLDGKLRRGTGSLTDIVAFARRLGINKLVLFPGDYPPDARARIVDQVGSLGGQILLMNSEGLVLSLMP